MALTAALNLFSGLTEEEVERLTSACVATSYQPGDRIFEEGDEGDELFIVKYGKVRIAKAISLDVDRTLATIGRGGVFGELVIVGAGTRSASAEAAEACEILSLARDEFVELTTETPELGLKIMGRFAAMLADRLRLTTDLLRDTVRWGLEISGAAQLDLHRVITSKADVILSLSNGDHLSGKLLKVDKSAAGHLLTLVGRDEELHLIPYHAVVSLRFGKTALLGGEEN